MTANTNLKTVYGHQYNNSQQRTPLSSHAPNTHGAQRSLLALRLLCLQPNTPQVSGHAA